jgi:beta-glucanase (GH16 family)
MIRKHSVSVIAAAVFAALSTAAVAQTQQRQSTGASQAAQTNPSQVVAPSAATGVESSANFRGNHNAIFMESQATTNQSTTANQNTGVKQGMGVSPSQSASDKHRDRRAKQRQSTGASQSAQTNPEQWVAPHAATGVESSANFRGSHNAIYMDSQATTNQSTTANQNTDVSQGMGVSPSQGRPSGVPGMGAVPGYSR